MWMTEADHKAEIYVSDGYYQQAPNTAAPNTYTVTEGDPLLSVSLPFPEQCRGSTVSPYN